MLEILTKFIFQVKHCSLPVFFSSSKMFSFSLLQIGWKLNYLPSPGIQPSTFWPHPILCSHFTLLHSQLQWLQIASCTPSHSQYAQHSLPHTFSHNGPPWQPHLTKKQVQLKSMSLSQISSPFNNQSETFYSDFSILFCLYLAKSLLQ